MNKNHCLPSSNWTIQKKHVHDANPRLLRVEPKGRSPIITPRMNYLELKGNWEYQLRCNIFCHPTSNLPYTQLILFFRWEPRSDATLCVSMGLRCYVYFSNFCTCSLWSYNTTTYLSGKEVILKTKCSQIIIHIFR